MQIPLDKFLACVRENAERITGYKLGHDGSDGKSDCIGLIIGALGLAGFRWPGTHGSNWAARNAMSMMEYIGSAADLFPGEIVYKVRLPGEPKYDLPDYYDKAINPRDYDHVGVVMSAEPLQIAHCSTGGMHYDTKLGAWSWGGRLKYVDYATVEKPEGGTDDEKTVIMPREAMAAWVELLEDMARSMRAMIDKGA